jgi:5-(carboxyamino)imidazole ribonucleotide synthase
LLETSTGQKINSASKIKQFKLAILGDGQLGTMLAESYLKIIQIFPEKNLKPRDLLLISCFQKGPGYLKFEKSVSNEHKIQTVLAINEEEILKALNSAEKVVLESEFFKHDFLLQSSAQFFPSLESYKNFEGKISQRLFYSKHQIPSVPFEILQNKTDVELFFNSPSLKFPIIAKKDRLSYDGLGNREINSLDELKSTLSSYGLPLLLEKKIQVIKEFAVGVLILNKKIKLFPLAETFQKNHICHLVSMPAENESLLLPLIENEIKKIADKLEGFFAFEFFLDDKNQLLINEGAPRPHNSMHITMDLCQKSQFDIILQALFDLPLSKSDFSTICHRGIMINLLGKKESSPPQFSLRLDLLKKARANYKAVLYLYGKDRGSIGRKLGHFNCLDINNDLNFFQDCEEIYREYEL